VLKKLQCEALNVLARRDEAREVHRPRGHFEIYSLELDRQCTSAQSLFRDVLRKHACQLAALGPQLTSQLNAPESALGGNALLQSAVHIMSGLDHLTIAVLFHLVLSAAALRFSVDDAAPHSHCGAQKPTRSHLGEKTRDRKGILR
jgi:hypothetical protein